MKFDPTPYAEGIRRLNAKEQREIDKRAGLAVSEAKRVAKLIGDSDVDIACIYLFGSLAEGKPKKLQFDIDLAFQGGNVYRAVEIAEESDFKIDVVQLDRLPKHIRERVKTRGRVIYERPQAMSSTCARQKRHGKNED